MENEKLFEEKGKERYYKKSMKSQLSQLENELQEERKKNFKLSQEMNYTSFN